MLGVGVVGLWGVGMCVFVLGGGGCACQGCEYLSVCVRGCVSQQCDCVFVCRCVGVGSCVSQV